MKKKMITAAFIFTSALSTYACTGSNAQSTSSTTDSPNKIQTENPQAQSGEVIQMDKALFISKVCDYETYKEEWRYKGDKPAIIDLYADWCGPCRMTAPILKELAKEYVDKIVIYKVNVDKERELAALFNATSIPLFVFIPVKGLPQLYRGAADKATYKKIIDEFLLKAQ